MKAFVLLAVFTVASAAPQYGAGMGYGGGGMGYGNGAGVGYGGGAAMGYGGGGYGGEFESFFWNMMANVLSFN